MQKRKLDISDRRARQLEPDWSKRRPRSWSWIPVEALVLIEKGVIDWAKKIKQQPQSEPELKQRQQRKSSNCFR